METRPRRLAVALAALLAAVLAVGAAAATSAGQRTAAAAPRASVTVYGPASATRVLLLVPGLGGGAGTFSLLGPELARRVPNLQVWAVDRRGDALEDPTGFSADPDTAYRYYFERLAIGGRTFDPNVAAVRPEAVRWGLGANLADLRAVVQRARKGGRTVLLGGHSLGAATTLAYAAWDFAGRAGYRDLDGLVLIDGGQLGTFGTPTAAQVRRELARLTPAKPFEDRLGIGVPWLFGVFAQLAATYARTAPDRPSALARSPLLPPAFRPETEVTNRAFFARSLGEAGISAERCGLDGASRMVGSTEPDAFDWYFPTRLKIDLVGAASLRPDPVTRLLGLRVRHLAAIDLPVYAFATGDIPSTLTGARNLLARSDVPRASSVLAQDPQMKHADPLCAPYAKSVFLRTLVPWLKRR
jgi:pimeloyl-ACP methyl ester carboxylesterase